MHLFSMELQSFEKPYGTLPNSANWVTGGPVGNSISLPYLWTGG